MAEFVLMVESFTVFNMKDVSFLTTSHLEPSSKIFKNNPCSALLTEENNFTGLFRVEICVSVEKKFLLAT